MFNIGPLELMVLAIVGLVVLGPDRLPGFIRDAGRLLRSLRDMATGARQQLRDELGPEFSDIDLRNLNPRTYVTKAIFGDEVPDLTKYDPRRFDARSAANNFIKGGDGGSANGGSANGSSAKSAVSMSKSPPSGGQKPQASRPRPRPNGSPGPGTTGRAPTRHDDTT